jgi:hypothetical protein
LSSTLSSNFASRKPPQSEMSGEEPHILDMVDGSNDEGENHPLLLSLNFRVKAMEMLT